MSLRFNKTEISTNLYSNVVLYVMFQKCFIISWLQKWSYICQKSVYVMHKAVMHGIVQIQLERLLTQLNQRLSWKWERWRKQVADKIPFLTLLWKAGTETLSRCWYAFWWVVEEYIINNPLFLLNVRLFIRKKWQTGITGAYKLLKCKTAKVSSARILVVHEKIGDFLRLPQPLFFPLSLLRGLVLYHINLYFHNQSPSFSAFQEQSWWCSIRQPCSLHFPVDMLGSHLEMASAISYAKMPTKKGEITRCAHTLKRHKIQTSDNSLYLGQTLDLLSWSRWSYRRRTIILQLERSWIYCLRAISENKGTTQTTEWWLHIEQRNVKKRWPQQDLRTICSFCSE